MYFWECVAAPDDEMENVRKSVLRDGVQEESGRQRPQDDVATLGAGRRVLEDYSHPHRRQRRCRDPPKAGCGHRTAGEEPKSISGDPGAVKDITQFYQSWVVKRDSAQASKFASQRSYLCLLAPSAAEKGLTPAARVQSALDRVLGRIPPRANLSDLMSSVQPVNDLLRPVEQDDSKAFAIMAVPDQMADSFLCQNRHLPEKTPELTPADAKYGTYYLSASRMNFGEEQSPALLLLWTKEKAGWKVVAWAVEVP